MKKWLIVSASCVLSLAAALPMAVGLGLEPVVNLLVSGLTTQTALGLADSRFERGYANSQLSLTFKPLLDGAPQSLQLVVHFKHGPLLVGAGLELGLLGVTAQLKANPTAQVSTSGDEPVYQLDGRIDLSGAGSFTDRYSPLALTLQQGRGQWSRGEGAGRLNWQTKHLDYEGRLSQLSWQSPNFALNLADTTIAKQVSLRADGLSWFSRVAFKALNAQVQADHYWLQRGALGIGGQASATDSAPGRWQLSLVAEEFKAKAVQLASLDANLALDQVPSDALLPFAALMLSSQAPEAWAQEANTLAQQYLKAPAELSIERLGAVQEGKTFWLSGRVDLAALAAMPQQAWQTAQGIATQLNGSGEIHLDKALLPLWAKAYLEASAGGNGQSLAPAQIEILAKAFVGQGMLTEEGANYSCKVVFNAGDISLNGKPMALPF
ncbi:MAG TPA: DUF945 family protein [Cellvibrionaceae bacterium]|nr:DUF945 family protein [Cellvibrionaceae bacterium]HMY39670.1 DUF945 family protein [Marinagarivorans sp.]